MPTAYVNDIPIELGTDRLNCIQAADRAGVFIPHYCYHEALSVVASCRMCLVEVGELKDGKVLMQPKVLPGCQTPVKENSVIVTGDYDKKPAGHPRLPYDSHYQPGIKAKQSQADTLEALLLNHPLDCPVCDKAGECKLQDFSFKYGRSESRMIDPKNTPANKPGISSKITLFTDRCIMCTRCVRFTREISGTGELMVTHRGHHEEIDVFPGMPLENKLSGNVVDLCPVGALGAKDFLYTQRVWYLKDHPGVCSLCSTGCSTYVDTNKDIVYRIRPRTNHQAQGYFICDDGRWGYHYVNSAKRFTRPQMMVDGRLQPVSWSTFLANIRKQITEVSRLSPDKLLLVLSPFLTVEEAFLWSVFGKELSAKTRLALGPVPVIGEDDRYPKDVHGNSVEPVKFTIRAEKCPNRLGVSTVLRHFQGELLHWNEMWNESDWQAMIFVGGYPNPHHLELMLPAELTLPRLTIVQDLFPSRLTKSASYVVPGTAVFEKEGTFVNHSGLAQSFPRAVRPPLEARGELQTAADLLGRLGLVQIRQIRQELAAILPEFATIESSAPIGKRLALATV